MAMNISGDHNQMRKVGNQLNDEQYKEYMDLVKRIYDEVDSLNSKWGGIDKTSFMSTLLNKRPAMDELGKCIQGYGNFLIASSNYLRKAQEEIADASANL